MKGDADEKPLAPLVAEIRRLYRSKGFRSERAFLKECGLHPDRLRSWADRPTRTAEQDALRAMSDKLDVEVVHLERFAAGRRIGSTRDKIRQEWEEMYEATPPKERARFVDTIRPIWRLFAEEVGEVLKRGRK